MYAQRPHRSRLPLLVLLLFGMQALSVVLPAAAAQGIRALPPEVGPLLRQTFSGPDAALALQNAKIDRDRVRATVCSTQAPSACFSFTLTDPLPRCDAQEVGPWCLAFPNGPPAPDLLAALVAALRTHAQQSVWRQVGLPSDPESVDFGADPQRPPAEPGSMFGVWWSSTSGLATLAWLGGLIALLAISIGSLVSPRPWTHPELRWASIEVLLLLGLALAIRCFLVWWGPGNLYSRVPDPVHLVPDYALFGPGFGAWLLGWFSLFGWNDTVAFAVGAAVGALSVLPVYLIGYLSTGQRLTGLAAGLALAIWPLHARLSPTDDPAGLIGLLLIAALAFLVAAEKRPSPALIIGAWLACALAAGIRPEPAAAILPLGILVLSRPGLRRQQFKLGTLIPSAIIGTLCAMLLWATVSRALHDFNPLGDLGDGKLLRLIGWEGASVLVPPRTHLVFGALFLLGLVVAFRRLGWRILLWMAVGFLPAVPTASLARADLITARYQLPILCTAAILIGFALTWLASILGSALPPRFRRLTFPAVALAPVLAACVAFAWPPPEPTFRREYAFFRSHLEAVPADCLLVKVYWNRDLGLGIPQHLTRLLGTGHRWISPDQLSDAPADRCLVYWQAASCRAQGYDEPPAPGRVMPACAAVESAFDLEPIAVATLPAHQGFCEVYTVEPVPIGFYKLHEKKPPQR